MEDNIQVKLKRIPPIQLQLICVHFNINFFENMMFLIYVKIIYIYIYFINCTVIYIYQYYYIMHKIDNYLFYNVEKYEYFCNIYIYIIHICYIKPFFFKNIFKS